MLITIPNNTAWQLIYDVIADGTQRDYIFTGLDNFSYIWLNLQCAYGADLTNPQLIFNSDSGVNYRSLTSFFSSSGLTNTDDGGGAFIPFLPSSSSVDLTANIFFPTKILRDKHLIKSEVIIEGLSPLLYLISSWYAIFNDITSMRLRIGGASVVWLLNDRFRIYGLR